MKGRSLVVFLFFFVYFLIGFAAADVHLTGRNFSVSFDVNFDELNFKGETGACGMLYVAEPLDACTQLTNKVANDSSSPYALIIRGGCSFDEKKQNAQAAGFKAAIVYDNTDEPFKGEATYDTESTEIIFAFVPKVTGEELKKYAGDTDITCCIRRPYEIPTWVYWVIAFLACAYVWRDTWRFICEFDRPLPVVRGMSEQRVKRMPISTSASASASDDNSTSTTCAICLDDYSVGEKLRVLPCHHKFHAVCVDSWLTAWRSFCPICKLDTETRTKNPPASENTPLLSAPAASPSSSSLPSFYPSVTGSVPIKIVPPPRLPSSSRIHSLSGLNAANSYESFSSPLSTTIFRSLPNLRHASSESLPYLVHPHSVSLPTTPAFPNISCHEETECRDNTKIGSKASVSSSL